ncbi:phosphoadenosine phosphosulfate reductase family protein [Thermodesulfobacteriota bacterium]
MNKRLDYSVKLVERAFGEKNISKESRAVLAFSGGIDSTLVLNLPPVTSAVKEGAVDLLFNDTLVEFKETREFIKRVQDELKVNVIVAKPKLTFKEIVKRYGFPIHPRGGKDSKRSKATSMCCYYLKKAPTKKIIKEKDWSLYFTGLRADESYNRRSMAKVYGDYFDSKTYGHKRCHPILWWSLDDVWAFQKRAKFAYNSLYDKVTYLNDADPDFSYENAKKYNVRTGCWCCPQGLRQGKLKWLREHFPKKFQALIIKMGLGEELLDLRIEKNKSVKSRSGQLLRDINYKELFGVERALQMHPCYFDSL